MLRWNIDIKDCLINRQIGTVFHFMSNHQQVLKIYVKFDDLRATAEASSHDNLGRSNRWLPIERFQIKFTLKKQSKSSVIVKRTPFPLILSYACTFHKVQRMNLSKAGVSLNLCNQKAFEPGQVYVTLSRIANFDGIYLTWSYNRVWYKK